MIKKGGLECDVQLGLWVLPPCQTGQVEADWWCGAASWSRPAEGVAGVDWQPAWDGELSLWPDETRPLSTYLFGLRGHVTRYRPTCLLPAGRALSALHLFFKKKVNIFTSSIHRLDLVYRLLALKFTPFCNVPPPTDPPHSRKGGMTRSDRLLGGRSGQPGPSSVTNPELKRDPPQNRTKLPAAHLWRQKFPDWSGSCLQKKESETRAIIEQRGGRIWRDYSQ